MLVLANGDEKIAVEPCVGCRAQERTFQVRSMNTGKVFAHCIQDINLAVDFAFAHLYNNGQMDWGKGDANGELADELGQRI